MTLYHGSERIIETPQFGAGNPRNDYGLGFYCTQHLELAKEWACQKNMDGFANEYELDLLGLSVLDVSGAEYTILHWLCILMQNRIFIPKTSFGKENLETLLAKYKLDYERFDVICGYRANDSYFTFASDFLENVIPIQHLATSMKLGELGMQVVLKSPKAFSQLLRGKSRRRCKSHITPRQSIGVALWWPMPSGSFRSPSGCFWKAILWKEYCRIII